MKRLNFPEQHFARELKDEKNIVCNIPLLLRATSKLCFKFIYKCHIEVFFKPIGSLSIIISVGINIKCIHSFPTNNTILPCTEALMSDTYHLLFQITKEYGESVTSETRKKLIINTINRRPHARLRILKGECIVSL